MALYLFGDPDSVRHYLSGNPDQVRHYVTGIPDSVRYHVRYYASGNPDGNPKSIHCARGVMLHDSPGLALLGMCLPPLLSCVSAETR